MKIDNDTDEDIDYNQTGGGTAGDVPGLERVPEGAGRAHEAIESQSGRIPPGQSADFRPRGKPPWTVDLTDGTDRCTVSNLTNASVTLTVNSLSDCDITQS